MDEERMVGHAPGSVIVSFDLTGRAALVTGAGGGIGGSIAIALASAGADVLCVGRTDEKLRAVIGRHAGPSRMDALAIDLAQPAHPERAVAECTDRFGRIDILVNAAAIQRRRTALEVSRDDWRMMIANNLESAFFASQAAASHMIRAGASGSIINITSLTAVIGLPRLAIHGAIKGAVNQMTKALAVEWAPHGIRVNCIGPGRIRTPMTEELFQDEEAHASFVNGIPMGRGGVPQDLDGVAVFLAADASSYVTGQTVYVDGGWLAGGGSALR